jgi:arsenate reductase
MSITIWHNPACGTSRAALGLIREAGYEPEVIDYVRAGWDHAALAALLTEAGLTPRQALRERGTPAAELGLLEPGVTDAAILDAMVADPVLVQRPLVRTFKGAVLARPAEAVLPLL